MDAIAFILSFVVIERSEFFRGLSEKSECDGPYTERPITTFLEAYISELVYSISIRSSPGIGPFKIR